MMDQSKLDAAAAAGILAMFLGAFLLTISPLGLLVISGGAAVMLFLFLKIARKRQ